MKTNENEVGKLFAEERKEQIISYLRTNKRANIHELIDKFQVSGATIRADLRELESFGYIKRTHGGAMYREDMLSDQDGIASRDSYGQEKQWIADKALQFIQNGETIILDAGTTNMHLARQLKEYENLTVVTNDIVVAGEIYQCPNIKIIFCGGEMRPMYGCTAGAGTMSFIQRLSVDRAFISPNALSVSQGAFTPNFDLAETKRAFMQSAEKNYLLCTSNKIGKKAMCQVARIEEFDAIFTDIHIRNHDLEALKLAEIPIYVCGEE
ncbi:MAG: DeoR/GlpR family DNA-binding transcription regulator [Lachnospiraceae bacterium]|nr:DeoR/GlpR family DNA-binding transcription regulator [Lachnospiraceae bacterium]